MSDHAGPVLITGADVVGTGAADILVRDGAIAEIGTNLDAAGATRVDADGLVALPGLVDCTPTCANRAARTPRRSRRVRRLPQPAASRPSSRWPTRTP